MIAHIFQIERHKNIENYAFNFIEFLKNNLDELEFREHVFYFSYFENESYKDSILKRLESISYPKNRLKYFTNHKKMMCDLDENNYINNIFHQLSSLTVFKYLYLNRKLLKRTSWMMWGGDVYHVFIDKLSLKYKIYDLVVRRHVIKNLKSIIGFKGDYDLLQTRYHSNAKYCLALYNAPSKIYTLEQYTLKRSDRIRILVAHNANKTNNHEEIFQKLLKYKNENIEIICPLSYGDLENGKVIEKRGYELFGDKFTPLKSFMTPEEFSVLLEDIDLSIFACNRQAAVGVLTSLISLGKKVYYKEEVVPFDFYESYEIKVYNTHDIDNESFEEFIKMSENIRVSNIEKINDLYNVKNRLKQWKNIFDS